MQAHDETPWALPVERVLDTLSGSRWVPLAVNLVALVLLVYGLSQWTWRLLQPASPPIAAAQRPVDPDQASLDLQALLAANLFGQVQTAGTADSQQLPLSSLNLVLTGVMTQGRSGFAFVSINGAAETPVMIGQEITAGATLESVQADRIVIRRGASLESVLLKDSDAALPAGSVVASAPVATNNSIPSPVQSLGSGRYSVDRQALTQGVTASALSQAAVTPGASGLVVREIQAGSIFDKLGLKTGDVVRSVNGQLVHGLDDVAKAYAQFAAAPQSGRVFIEVVRGGKPEVLHYQMQ